MRAAALYAPREIEKVHVHIIKYWNAKSATEANGVQELSLHLCGIRDNKPIFIFLSLPLYTSRIYMAPPEVLT